MSIYDHLELDNDQALVDSINEKEDDLLGEDAIVLTPDKPQARNPGQLQFADPTTSRIFFGICEIIQDQAKEDGEVLGATISDVVDQTGLTEAVVRNRIDYLFEEKNLVRRPPAGRRPAFYLPTDFLQILGEVTGFELYVDTKSFDETERRELALGKIVERKVDLTNQLQDIKLQLSKLDEEEEILKRSIEIIDKYL
jgi:hypothetical protein